MPSPYGSRRGPSTYYEYGGVPQQYVYKWDGLPQGSTRAGETRSLGCLGDSFIDVKAEGHFYRDLGLGAYDTAPVAMSMYSGRRSLLHSGPEQTHLYDAALSGLFNLSENEKQFLTTIAGVGVAVYWLWKTYGKKRK